LPDINASPTAKFKQVTTLSLPTSVDGETVGAETVILQCALPNNGLLIAGPGVGQLPTDSFVEVFPDAYHARKKFLRGCGDECSDSELLFKLKQRLFRMIMRKIQHNVNRQLINLSHALTTPMLVLGGFTKALPLVFNGDSYWARVGANTTSNIIANGSYYINPSPSGEAPEYRWTSETGTPVLTGSHTVSGFPVQTIFAQVTTGAAYACSLSINNNGSPASILVNLRNANTDAIIGQMNAGTATPVADFFSTAPVSQPINVTSTFVGPMYFEFVVSNIGGGPGFGLANMTIELPSGGTTGQPIALIPTPDAGTIMGAVNGIRVCAQEMLTTYVGSTLEDSGQIVCAKLPQDYFDNFNFSSISFQTVANFPVHYDGRFADGGRSILPPFGPQQSRFLDESDDFFGDKSTVFPFIVHVIKNSTQPCRVRATTLLEGVSTSQLFSNRPNAPDSVSYQRTAAAMSVINTDSANFIHVAIMSAALIAWKAACAAVPLVVDACKWVVKFSDVYKSNARMMDVDKRKKKI
jgi:hypothetical protein